eukprot:3953000-Alexandrium_andersonii.AAC.1
MHCPRPQHCPIVELRLHPGVLQWPKDSRDALRGGLALLALLASALASALPVTPSIVLAVAVA